MKFYIRLSYTHKARYYNNFSKMLVADTPSFARGKGDARVYCNLSLIYVLC